MDKLQKYKHWESLADYDMETARAMLKSGRHLYVVFMCQQGIEKIIKGIFVLFTGEEPPRTHNIWNLFKGIFNNSSYILEIPGDILEKKKEDYKPFFLELVAYYISGRYPDYKNNLSQTIDKKKAEEVLYKAEEVFLWLKSLNK